MAEHLPENIEYESKQSEETKPEHRARQSEKAAEHQANVPDIEKLRSRIQTEAKTAKEVTIGEKETPKSEQPTHVNRELKLSAYMSSLKTIRAKLNAPDRLASRIIHQPVIEQVSNLASQTLARPAGILGGAACALIGSLTLLIFAKTLGIKYNYLIVFVFYAVGFTIGLVIEMLSKAAKPGKNSRH